MVLPNPVVCDQQSRAAAEARQHGLELVRQDEGVGVDRRKRQPDVGRARNQSREACQRPLRTHAPGTRRGDRGRRRSNGRIEPVAERGHQADERTSPPAITTGARRSRRTTTPASAMPTPTTTGTSASRPTAPGSETASTSSLVARAARATGSMLATRPVGCPPIVLPPASLRCPSTASPPARSPAPIAAR